MFFCCIAMLAFLQFMHYDAYKAKYIVVSEIVHNYINGLRVHITIVQRKEEKHV